MSSLLVLWSEKMLDMISIFLNLLRFDLWPKMWSILENVPCALEKVYSTVFGWNVLKISVRSISSKVSFKTCVSFLIFCFDDLSIGVSGVLKSLTIIVLLSISPFMSVSVCFGEGNGNPLQCSCLENPWDRGAWWAAVYGVAQSQTQLKWLSSSSMHPT